jgi:hypothetical protein
MIGWRFVHDERFWTAIIGPLGMCLLGLIVFTFSLIAVGRSLRRLAEVLTGSREHFWLKMPSACFTPTKIE